MNFITIALGATGISLLVIIGWLASLSAKKKRLALEKDERERAYRRAIERQRSEERKERVFKAETGHVPTQLYLAKEAEMNNPREALYWYEQAALIGSEIAMYGVVRVCGRAKDDVVLNQKSKFWQIAIEAHNGNTKAQLELGKAFLGGKGIEQDTEKGIASIEEVANGGDIEAQLFMGDWYIAESNNNPNPKLSAEWHFKAAQQNSSEGQLKLGIHYRDGSGVEKNTLRAIYWFEVASEQGNAEAQYLAGDVWIGRGSKGNAIAYLWLFLSAYFGHEPAKSRRDDVGNILGVDAVVGIQGMAKPLLRKLTDGALVKHSMVKALNKLYKRESYFPDRDGNEFLVYEPKLKEEPEENTDTMDFSYSPIDKH